MSWPTGAESAGLFDPPTCKGARWTWRTDFRWWHPSVVMEPVAGASSVYRCPTCGQEVVVASLVVL